MDMGKVAAVLENALGCTSREVPKGIAVHAWQLNARVYPGTFGAVVVIGLGARTVARTLRANGIPAELGGTEYDD